MDFAGKKKEQKALIRCNNLSVGYGQQVVASGISFEVHAGDYLCIIGENGSGKSTLMKTLLGMQPPISGELWLEETLRRQGIGYLPQQSAAQKDFPASVKEIVQSGCQRRAGLRPYYNKEEKALAASMMERLGIDGIAKHSYRNLSGGQQQRVLLARAICATRELLLLDEPVAGLDPGAMQEMYKVIQELNDEGTTIIMISHDVEQAMEYASHILQMGEVPFFMPKGGNARNKHWKEILPMMAAGRVGKTEPAAAKGPGAALAGALAYPDVNAAQPAAAEPAVTEAAKENAVKGGAEQ